jgi:hypothetical protein
MEMTEPNPPGNVIGQITVIAEAEVIKASDVEASEPDQEDDES